MVQLLRQQSRDGQIDLLNADWAKMVNVETLDIDDREPLRLEQEAFVQAIVDQTRPQVSAEDAVTAMELADRIVSEINRHQWDGYSSAITDTEHTQEQKKTKKLKV
jgi:predicted dehydrogenase